jgi:hypothetical protein
MHLDSSFLKGPAKIVGTFLGMTNITATPFIIKTINYTGDIHLTDYCPDTVEPGASCQISVTFTPITLGNLTGSIIIRDASPGNAISPETIHITGTGTH